MCSVGSDGKKSHRVLLHFGLRCALAAMITATGAVQAQVLCPEHHKLTGSDTQVRDQFGRSVSLSGQTVLVGAHSADCAAGIWCGSAYVFRLTGTEWVEEQKLTASDAGEDEWFGFSVSVSGNTAVAGAFEDDCVAGDGCGSAYVFRFSGTSWAEEQKLTASDAGEGDRFGYSVSVTGETVIVGARRDDCAAGHSCGSAYVFRFNGTSWAEEQKLTPSDAATNQLFGTSVSLSGNKAVVGAILDDCATGRGCGSAYVFRFNGTNWVEEQKLTASVRGERDSFGH